MDETSQSINPQIEVQTKSNRLKIVLLISTISVITFLLGIGLSYFIFTENNQIDKSMQTELSEDELASTDSITTINRNTEDSSNTQVIKNDDDWTNYYNDTVDVIVKYPSNWQISGLAPTVYLFAPNSYTPSEIDELNQEIPGVVYSMLVSSYGRAISLAGDSYDLETKVEQISVGDLSGLHIWGTGTPGVEGGAFIVKNSDGNAFEFKYKVIDNISYKSEAMQIMQSLIIGENTPK